MTRWRRTVEDSPDRLAIALSVLLFGSIWGLAEATLGGALHAVHFADKGGVMGGIGMAIMGTHLGLFRRPRLLPLLGVIAAMFKPLDAIVVGAPVFSNFVINPATAIVLEALAFGAVATIVLGKMGDFVHTRIATSVLSAFAGYGAYAVVASWAGLGRWPVWRMGDKLGQVWHDGSVIALAGTVLFLGLHAVSSRTRPAFHSLHLRRPALMRFAGLGGALCCWSTAAAVSARFLGTLLSKVVV